MRSMVASPTRNRPDASWWGSLRSTHPTIRPAHCTNPCVICMKTSSSVCRCVPKATTRKPASIMARSRAASASASPAWRNLTQSPPRLQPLDARPAAEPVGQRRGGVQQADFHAILRLPALPLDFLDRPHGQQPPALQDAHHVADGGQLGQDVRADEDRLAGVGQGADHLPQLDTGPRIEPRRRLIQDHDRRIVHQCPAQAEPLLHPLGQPVDRLLGQHVQAGEGHHAVDGVQPPRAAKLIRPRVKIEVLADVDVGIGGEIVGHETDAAADPIGIVDHGEAVDHGVAGRGQVERGQDPHARRLAGAVGADVAEDLSLVHREGDAVHRPGAVEVPVQVPQLDHGTGSRHHGVTYHWPTITFAGCHCWLVQQCRTTASRSTAGQASSGTRRL